MKTLEVNFVEGINSGEIDSITELPENDSMYCLLDESDDSYMSMFSFICGKPSIKIVKTIPFCLILEVTIADGTCTEHRFDSECVSDDIICIDYEKVKISFLISLLDVNTYHILDQESLIEDPDNKEEHYFTGVSYVYFNPRLSVF